VNLLANMLPRPALLLSINPSLLGLLVPGRAVLLTGAALLERQ